VNSPREMHEVELVDDTGRPLGTMTVAEAHTAPGRLHRAFSVLLTDPDGRLLLQRRAAAKTRFPGRLANACCGHPAPGESLSTAATRRLHEEIGLGPVELSEVGVYMYYAEDPVTHRVEFEYDHVLHGRIDAGEALLPDPDEVSDLVWVSRDELTEALRTSPRTYAPWLSGVVSRLFTHERSRTSAEQPGGV
jgi:isopentenyl-diphosphate Delta-isomerase